jgi:hypothetical protein
MAGRDGRDGPGARESCCTDCTCCSIECSGTSVREDVLNPECPDGIMEKEAECSPGLATHGNAEPTAI